MHCACKMHKEATLATNILYRFNRKYKLKRIEFYWTDVILMDSQFLYFIGIHFNCGLKRKLFWKHWNCLKHISAIPQKKRCSLEFLRKWNLFVHIVLVHIGIRINQTANHVNNEHKISSTMQWMCTSMNETFFLLLFFFPKFSSKRCRKRDISTFMFNIFTKDKKI